jgi:4-amino-4-deoxy-L-arabinose transferase-like glycosyltransferase
VKRKVDWVIVALLLLATLLRFPGLGARSLWFDEALSVSISRLDTYDVLLNVPGSFHPPGYYLLLHLWQPLGDSAFVLRFPSSLLSLLAMALTCRLACEFFGRRAAWSAASGMALSPFQVYYAQEARMYGPAIALGAGVVWAFLRAVQKERHSAWVIYGVFAVLGLYVYYYLGLVLMALHLWFLLDPQRLRRVLVQVAVADALVALAFLPQALGFLFRKSSAFLSAGRTTGIPNPLELFRTLYYLLFIHVMPLWIVPLGLFVVLGMLAVTVLMVLRQRHTMAFAPLLVVLVPMVTVLALSALVTPLYIERSFALVTPALVVLLAHGLATAPRRSPLRCLGAGLGLLLAFGTLRYHVLPDPAKPPVREAALAVEKGAQVGDAIVHLQDASYLPALSQTPDAAGALLDVGQRLWLSAETYARFGGRVIEPGDIASDRRMWLVVMPGYLGRRQQAFLEAWQPACSLVPPWQEGAIQLRICLAEEMQ